MDWETWGPPLFVLAVGVAVGLGLALTSGEDGSATTASQSRREDLAARKASLMDQLRALDGDRGKLDPAVFQARRNALVDEAAKVLQQLESVDTTPAPEPAPVGSSRGALTAGLWSAGVLLFFGLLAVFLSTSSQERAAGETMTGGVMSNQESAVAAAREALAEDPQDIDALNVLAYDALLGRDLQAAMQHVEAARTIDADHPDVHIHLAILQISIGMSEKAVAELERAIELQPDRGRPLLWLGLIQLQTGSYEASVTTLESALQKGLRADEQQFARSMLADARNPDAMRARAAAQAGGGAAAPSGPYVGPGGGGLQVAGTVAAAPEGVPTDRTVFVGVYASEAGGRPVAMARITAAELPFEFAFEEGHTMAGGPWPEQFWVRARIDADGRPGASEGDVDSQMVGPLAGGTQGVALTF